MDHFRYWPYDEVSLSMTPDRQKIVVKAPWIEAKIAVTPEDRPDLENLVAKFHSPSKDDVELVQWFFGELSSYPFCYILPALKTKPALDAHALRDARFLTGEFEDLIRASLDVAPSTAIDSNDMPRTLARLSRKNFDWDVESATAFARVGDKVHPESLFTVVRRYHLIEVLQSDKGREAFAFVETLTGDAFAKAASSIVRQNHYVTQKCQESLAPAIQLAGRARPKVEEFLKEENGHDLILGAALKTLVPDPEQIPICSQTSLLMHLLKFAATRNFLAFAMIVNFFERSSYQSTDPMAQLLQKGGFDKAARQVNRHMEINDAGEHENIACDFLSDMAPCDLNYAKEAMRIAEVVSTVMNSLSSAAVAEAQV